MKGIVIILICMLGLSGCGKDQIKSETLSQDLYVETTASGEHIEDVGREKDSVMAYFKQNGQLKGDNYIIERQFTEETPGVWSISEKHPEIVSCHAVIENMFDIYFRYYLDTDIISFNCDTYGTYGSRDAVFSTFSVVDAVTYQVGDEISILQILIDGEIADSTFFNANVEGFAANTKVFIETLYGQLKEFGLPEKSNNRNEARNKTQMIDYLPAEDKCAEQLNGSDSVKKAIIPEEYQKDAAELELYNAVNEGDTECLLSILGEADILKNVKHNQFSEFIDRNLNEMGFYKATEFQQNFLEMYSVLGENNTPYIDAEEIKAVYISGYSQDGSGNNDNKLDTKNVVVRCIMVQTELDNCYLFVNQMVGLLNPYESEQMISIGMPEIKDGQFKLPIVADEQPFSFTKIEDSFCNLERAMKAYRIGQIIKEFNSEYIKEWNEYYKKKETSKYEPGIGMTKQEVIDSSWGKPSEINSLDTIWGTHHEQWVYGDNRYVYFDDGIVTAIQNHGRDIF